MAETKLTDTAKSSSSPSSPTPQDAAQTPPAQGLAVRGASLLIVLQIASRGVTFVANQLLLRFLTARLLGVSTQLEVYYLSVLFFARESLRVAIQRQATTTSSSSSSSSKTPGADKEKENESNGDDKGESARDSQSVVNVGHLAVALGTGAAIGLGGAYLYYVDAATASTPYLAPALYIYGVASVIELLSEPAFVVLQHRLRFGPRAAAESVATLLRCLVTFATAGFAWRTGAEIGVLPFALGQLGYGVGLLGVYLWYGSGLSRAEGFSLLPKSVTAPTTTTTTPKQTSIATAKIGNGKAKEAKDDAVTTIATPATTTPEYALGYFYRPTLALATSMTAQSVVKHILTQGDTFLVSILSDPQSQGVYALANNYGSLLARLVFQPIEESSRNYFSKLLSTTTSNNEPDNQDAKPPASALAQARTSLHALLRFYFLLSALVVTVGPPALPLLVQLVAGPRWSASGAGAVLARYCLFVPLLAANGVTEAFVASVAAPPQLRRQSLWMAAFSLAFAAAGYVALRVLDLGAAGLVYANAVNMLCRIVWSARFISGYFAGAGAGRGAGGGFGWVEAVPRGMAIYVPATAVFWQALTMVGVSVGEVSPRVYRDLVAVAVLAVPYVATLAFLERNYLLDCYRTIRGRRASAT